MRCSARRAPAAVGAVPQVGAGGRGAGVSAAGWVQVHAGSQGVQAAANDLGFVVERLAQMVTGDAQVSWVLLTGGAPARCERWRGGSGSGSDRRQRWHTVARVGRAVARSIARLLRGGRVAGQPGHMRAGWREGGKPGERRQAHDGGMAGCAHFTTTGCSCHAKAAPFRGAPPQPPGARCGWRVERWQGRTRAGDSRGSKLGTGLPGRSAASARRVGRVERLTRLVLHAVHIAVLLKRALQLPLAGVVLIVAHVHCKGGGGRPGKVRVRRRRGAAAAAPAPAA